MRHPKKHLQKVGPTFSVYPLKEVPFLLSRFYWGVWKRL